jgi:membrane-associated phospholipid phosphatase
VAALWPVPVLRWLFLALNVAMLVATPIDGSHYFIDVFAGVALAALCLVAAQAIAARVGGGSKSRATEPADAARPARA